MPDTEFRPDLLLRLADHLEHGKLGHKVFDFSMFNSAEHGKHNTCGTAGCAIGECPILFPDSWEFVLYTPQLRHKHSHVYAFEAAEIFFGLTSDESSELFAGHERDIDLTNDAKSPWNDKLLYSDAPKEQVAAGIRSFVEWRKTNPPYKQPTTDAED